MRRLRLAAVIGLIGCGGAGPLTPKSSVDEVLDALQARGQDLQSFKADVTETRTDSAGDEVTYFGHLAFQSLPGGDGRLRYALDAKQKGAHPRVPYRQDYLLDHGLFINRDYSSKSEMQRQVVRPGEKLNPFELGKGQIPLPIGQEKAKVLQLFDVTEPPAEGGDPPRSVHLRLVPKPESEFARKYQSIDFWVDVDRRMPVRIESVEDRGSKDDTFDLTKLVVNPPTDAADFTLPPQDESLPPVSRKWTTDVKAFGQ